MYSEKLRSYQGKKSYQDKKSYQGRKSTKIIKSFFNISMEINFSLEKEKVRLLVQTFGVDIKQVVFEFYMPLLKKKIGVFLSSNPRFFCTIEWLKASKLSAPTIPLMKSSTQSSSTSKTLSRFLFFLILKFFNKFSDLSERQHNTLCQGRNKGELLI